MHLNRYGTIVFSNTSSKFLSEYYWRDHDNSKEIHLVQDNYNKELKSYLQVLGKENQTSVSNLVETLNEVTFESEESTLKNESISDSFEERKNTRLKNPNKLIIAQLNIYSLCNKFESLVRMLHNDLDTLLICEANIDFSFPTAQFQIEGYATYKLDRNANGGNDIGRKAYNKECNLCVRLIRSEKKNFFSNIITNDITDNKIFFGRR